MKVRTRKRGSPQGPRRLRFSFFPIHIFKQPGLRPNLPETGRLSKLPDSGLRQNRATKGRLKELYRRANPPLDDGVPRGRIYVPSDFVVNCLQQNRPRLPPAGVVVMIPPF
jgi:hypothetical protein